MSIEFRPLGKVLDVIESTGFKVSYPYDDLIFVEGNAFIVQFELGSNDSLALYFNQEIEKEAIGRIESMLGSKAKVNGFHLKNRGFFSLKEKQDAEEELELQFFPN